MMYNNKIAVALKSAKGKVLREFGETVYVPFGEEYSVFVKNLNNVRALVSISVDGTDIGDGTRFIVNPNDSIDIERFVKGGNFNAGNRLKFIERTEGVEKHRGIKVEDGLIRVEVWFEKLMPVYKPTPVWTRDEPFYNYRDYTLGGSNDPTIYGNNTANYSSEVKTKGLKTRGISGSSMTCNSVGTVQASVNDAGITVEGSISKQQFTTGAWFPTESTSHVIVLKMLGQTENTKVKAAVTTKAKAECKTCGRVNKATSKFCSECGTSLQIV